MEKLTKEEYEVDARVVLSSLARWRRGGRPIRSWKDWSGVWQRGLLDRLILIPRRRHDHLRKKVEFATELARRWNAGRAGVAKEQRE